jgi:16S rRNA (uracil1498-N3)-methyltransferase
VTSARFFLDRSLAEGDEVELPTAVAHHAARVLRLRAGASVVLFNNRGGEYEASLVGSGTNLRAKVVGHAAIERESPLAVTLVQAWIATDKLDWTIEKAVELGVRNIVLAPTQRAVVSLTDVRRERRVERLREIAIAACSQCGRNRVPSVEAADTLELALQEPLTSGALGLVLDAQADSSLIALAPGNPTYVLAVGPEGGFEAREIALATRLGYRCVRLGPRILRTETAGLAALAALQATAGDFRAA